MDAREIFDSYFANIAEQGPTALADYTQNLLWTPRATLALVRVGLKVFPAGEAVAKGLASENEWGRSEYLCLDVTITDPKTWGPPVFIAETENSPLKSRVQYDAWKLTSVDARRRVLVAYWGKGTEFKTFEQLRAAVHEVCAGQPGKDILLIGGDYNARPTTIGEFRRAHETSIVGMHSVR